MTKTKKTQSPLAGSKAPKTKAAGTKKTAAKKAVRKKPAPKTARSKTAKSGASSASPEFDMNEFAALWQQKWQEMLQEQGWPEQAAMPSVGQMPFMMPFMMPNMGMPTAATGMDSAMLQNLQQRILQLEYRIMELEHKLLQRNAKKS